MPSEKERITAYVSPSLLKKMKIHCATKGYSLSAFIEMLLVKALEKENEQRATTGS